MSWYVGPFLKFDAKKKLRKQKFKKKNDEINLSLATIRGKYMKAKQTLPSVENKGNVLE